VLNSDPNGSQTELSAREPGGSVDVCTLDSDQALAASVGNAARRHRAGDGNSVFVLARTNYQVQAIASALKTAGVPYERLGSRGSVWDKELGELLVALKALRDGHGVVRDPLQTLLSTAVGRRQSRVSDSRVNFQAMKENQALAASDVWQAFPDAQTAADIIPFLDVSDYRRDALYAALTSAEDLHPSDVRIGTIHSAKGLEAPCVYLHASAAPQMMDRYNAGETSEEHRLYYVGATRASEELAIVRGYFDDDTFPVFERFRAPDEPEEVTL
jgi:superfamily I DNA/RNA helicase